MTTTTDPFAQAAAELGAVTEVAPITVNIAPEPDTRLSQLLEQYDMAKAEAAKAEQALKAITDGIKSELTKAAPGATQIDVAAPGLARPLRLSAVESWRVDATRLKAEQPLTYVQYAKASTSYRLVQVGSTI